MQYMQKLCLYAVIIYSSHSLLLFLFQFAEIVLLKRPSGSSCQISFSLLQSKEVTEQSENCSSNISKQCY